MKKKAVLLSLNSEWVNPIFKTHEKIYEVRRRAPLLTPPYDVYVYCTKKEPKINYESNLFKGELNGLVIGKFTCTNNLIMTPPWRLKENGTSLSAIQLATYSAGDSLIFMEISNPKLFDVPFGLGLFGIEHAPMSWQYIEVQDG